LFPLARYRRKANLDAAIIESPLAGIC